MDPEAYKKYNKPEKGAEPGVYKHPGTTEELHAANFPAADAFVRQGWVYDRPLPSATDSRKVAEAENKVKSTPTELEEKSLSKQNKAELTATAEKEGVEVTEDLDTNAKLADAIQTARDEKEKGKE